MGPSGTSPRLNMAALNPELSLLRFSLLIQKTSFFVTYPKNVIFKFSVEPFWMKDPEVLFRDENPGRLHVTFFIFSQRPKVSSNIVVAIENMNMKLHLPCARGIHPWQAAPLPFHSAGRRVASKIISRLGRKSRINEESNLKFLFYTTLW